MAATFEWTQPVGGKKLTWRPLRVGDQMDLDANYSRSDLAYQKKYAAYAMRITSYEGQTPGGKFQVSDFREWDEYDLEAFAEEVAMQEIVRANALAKGRPGSPVDELGRKIEAAQLAVQQAGESLRLVLAAAKLTEQALGPLVQPSPPESLRI